MELIRRFDQPQLVSALESWHWLDRLEALTPRFMSGFGDVFLATPDGAYWFLDTVEGTLTRRWDDAAGLQSAVHTRVVQDECLRVDLVTAASEAGLFPGASEVLSFKTPPVLGGAAAVENVEVADLDVTMYLLGQIHEQVRGLPPGSTIGSVTATEPAPADAPRLQPKRRWFNR